MATIAAQTIVDTTDALAEAVNSVINWYAENPEYSQEGRRAGVQRTLQAANMGYPAAVAALEEAVDAYRDAATEQLEAEIAIAWPRPKTSTDTLAAELEAQRLLARGKDAMTVIAVIRDTAPSAGRTIYAEEAVARGFIERDTLEATAAMQNPEITTGRKELAAVAQFHRIMRGYLAEIKGHGLNGERVSFEGYQLKLKAVIAHMAAYYHAPKEIAMPTITRPSFVANAA